MGRDYEPALAPELSIDTTNVYASIKPSQLKRAMSLYEAPAARMLNK